MPTTDCFATTSCNCIYKANTATYIFFCSIVTMTIHNLQEEEAILNVCATGDCYYGAGCLPKNVYITYFRNRINWPATGRDILKIVGIE